MVLTAGQTAAFFEDEDQMAIPHETVLQLQNEGITDIQDLADFDKETLVQVANNLRRPGGRIPDPAVRGGMVATPPFVFGAKSQLRLGLAGHLVRYYNTVGRELSAGNMKWDPVIKDFREQYQALKDRKD